jgi:hypothetical protein
MLAVGFAGAAPADPLAETARTIVDRNGGSAVTLRIVTEMRFTMGGQQVHAEENEDEIGGTVLESDGLIVMSLSASDPSEMLQDAMASMAGQGVEISSDLKSLAVILPDGRDVPATVVLRDRDLDLAFVRTEEPLETPLPAVDTGASGSPDRFDPVVVPYRMGKAARREVGAVFTRVAAVLEKPRLFYVLPIGTPTDVLGSVAYDSDGKPVGIVIVRSLEVSQTEGASATLFVVPLTDVLEVAGQAPVEAPEAEAPAAGDAGSAETEG